MEGVFIARFWRWWALPIMACRKKMGCDAGRGGEERRRADGDSRGGVGDDE